MLKAKELSPVPVGRKLRWGEWSRKLSFARREPSPHTRRAMTLEEIFSLSNLYAAHRAAKRCKRGKEEVIKYELNLAYNLCRARERAKSYRPGKYKEFTVYEPKERLIQALHYSDRVVQHALCDNLLAPYLETRLIEDNVACRKGKGTHYGLKRLTEHLRRHFSHFDNKGWCLKVDVRKYFASIDHEVLKGMLARERFDPDVLQLMFRVIDSYNKDEGVGLPIGNQTSQNFALLYLDKLDRFVKERARVKGYVRYMDDMILLHEDREKLRQTLHGMEQIARRDLKLEFNEKTQITPLRNGIDFLGWHFSLTKTGKVIRRLRQASKRRIFARMTKLRKDYSRGLVTVEQKDASIASIMGHLGHGNAHKLLCEILKRAVFQRNSGEEICETED